MLSEARSIHSSDVVREYSITPQAVEQCEVLARKVVELVNQWKHRVTQQATSTGATARDFKQEMIKYISKQTNHQLYIGTIHGLDHNIKEERAFRVLLQAGTNVGGFFDDYMGVELLEMLKLSADKIGVNNTAKKYKVRRSVVGYAHETPVKDLMPLRGRGDIVIDLNEVIGANPMPHVVDILTHELTHGVQTLEPTSDKYEASIRRMHAGKKLNRPDWRAYYRDPHEFEAQLNGFIASIKYRYKDKGSPEALKKEMSQSYTPDEIEMLSKGKKFANRLKERQQLFKQDIIDRLLNMPREVAQHAEARGEIIRKQIKQLYDNAMAVKEQIDELNDKIEAFEVLDDESNMGEAMQLNAASDKLHDKFNKLKDKSLELENKYYILKISRGQFIANIASDDALWDEFKQKVQEMVDQLD